MRFAWPHEGRDQQISAQHEEEGRAQPEKTPNIEAPQVNRSGLVIFLDQDRGDEESGQDKEQVYADIAANEDVWGGMKEHDDENRQRPQPVETRRITQPTPPLAGR